ncbi:hypothetical protein AB0M39_32400 [Streptomyces sp. NPDC051907]|uniref:hypothetical protein n=1 Tax=Streptomyces sp. NPDC051907 TaxID=3155284 RepID=UPI00341F4138
MDVPIVCGLCGWDQFEVAAGECFCETCCVPLGIQDGGIYSDASVCSLWSLAPSDASHPAGSGGASVTPADPVRCPAGHDLFHVAAAYTITANGQISRLSVGLRCLVDGALSLFVDNARVVRRRH